MIGMDGVLVEFNLAQGELERWIAESWVRPEGTRGNYRFHDMDVARIRLILLLREDLEVSEAALPTVLSLLDQLYQMRRDLRTMNDALGGLPPELRDRLRAAL